MAQVDEFASEMLAQKREKERVGRERQQKVSDTQESRDYTSSESDRSARFKVQLEEEGETKKRTAQETERQKYQVQIDVVKAQYRQAQESGDVAKLRVTKAMLLDIPEDFRPIKLDDVEKDIDNTHRRNKEDRATSELDETRAMANELRKKLLEAKEKGDAALVKKYGEQLMWVVDPANAFLYQEGFKGPKEGEEGLVERSLTPSELEGVAQPSGIPQTGGFLGIDKLGGKNAVLPSVVASNKDAIIRQRAGELRSFDSEKYGGVDGWEASYRDAASEIAPRFKGYEPPQDTISRILGSQDSGPTSEELIDKALPMVLSEEGRDELMAFVESQAMRAVDEDIDPLSLLSPEGKREIFEASGGYDLAEAIAKKIKELKDAHSRY
jgi:hypothetical protein